MPLLVSEVYASREPTRWRDFDRHVPGVPMRAFGFRGELGDINRWRARYRAAASFESAVLVEYQSREIVAGYSALIRATLVWSAFERYLPLVGLEQRDCAALLAKYRPEEIAQRVAALDRDQRLYTYIRSKVNNHTLAAQLDAYMAGDQCNVTYLLSAIRHIFGHGHLTPASNDVESTTTIQVCDALSDFHLRVMDHDFSAHVEEFERMMRGIP